MLVETVKGAGVSVIPSAFRRWKLQEPTGLKLIVESFLHLELTPRTKERGHRKVGVVVIEWKIYLRISMLGPKVICTQRL